MFRAEGVMAKPNVAKPTTRKSKDAGKSKGKANAATTIDPAVLLFVQVVNDLTFKNGANAPGTPLRSLTFWVGAGFSKAWSAKSLL